MGAWVHSRKGNLPQAPRDTDGNGLPVWARIPGLELPDQERHRLCRYVQYWQDFLDPNTDLVVGGGLWDDGLEGRAGKRLVVIWPRGGQTPVWRVRGGLVMGEAADLGF